MSTIIKSVFCCSLVILLPILSGKDLTPFQMFSVVFLAFICTELFVLNDTLKKYHITGISLCFPKASVNIKDSDDETSKGWQ